MKNNFEYRILDRIKILNQIYFLNFICIFLQVRESLALTSCTGVVTKVLPKVTKDINEFSPKKNINETPKKSKK